MSSGDEQGGDQIEILLVEPNSGDVRLFTENFKEAKIANTIHDVSDGDEALDFLHQRGEYKNTPRPDLILLEPQLPGKSGMDVLSELKNQPALNEIPIIVLTSSDAGERIVQSHGLDADSYIQKPVEPEEFIDFVQSVEEFWLSIIQKPKSGD